MDREIVFDTETTGFDAEGNDRVVEIGCLELVNHMPTGKTFHIYINPQREMPASAFEVHGLSDEFLAAKPVFAEVVEDFMAFIGDSRLIAHNATFDLRFINAELARLELPPVPKGRAIDTLAIARQKYPGAQNSLDALCRRFNVDNSGRTLHGALLDSELLAEVYLELIGGRQPGLTLKPETEKVQTAVNRTERPPRSFAPTDEEAAAHAQFVADQITDAIWLDRD